MASLHLGPRGVPDVSFLIDSALGLGIDERPFDGTIDASRIGLTG